MMKHYLISEVEVLEAPVNDELIKRVCDILDKDAKFQTLENVIERLCNVIDMHERWIDHLEEMVFEDR